MRFGYLLHNLDHVWLNPQAFAHTIFDKGSPLRDAGNARPICRPVKNQRMMFPGTREPTVKNLRYVRV